MWVFTDVADWFDKTRQDNEKWIDSELQPWVATTLYDDSPWYRNVGVWTASGTLYALNKFTTTVAAGFVDVLRLGDGVKEGGWGYGKDALRLLMFLGPAVRLARWGAALVPAVDATQSMGNCGWIIAARVARWTGVKPFAELADLAKAAGLNSIKATGGVLSVDELAQPLENLGVSTKIVKGVGSMKDLATIAAENPNGTVMFGVRWINPNTGKGAGHVLYAVRNLFGGITIVDRTGEFATTLADLEEVVPKTAAGNSYLAGIGKGTVDATAIVAKNSPLVTSLGTVPTVANVISAASAASGENGASNQPSGSTVSRAASAAAGSGGATKAAGSAVTPGTLSVTTSTICIQPNSDMPVSCTPSVTKTYKVGRGEGLSMIAQRVYGDASKWQVIAAANGIKPPKYMIYPGQVLIIP